MSAQQTILPDQDAIVLSVVDPPKRSQIQRQPVPAQQGQSQRQKSETTGSLRQKYRYIPRSLVKHNYQDRSSELPDGKESEYAPRGGVAMLFPVRLYQCLGQLAADGLSHLCSWQPHGRAFVVHKPYTFEKVMHRYFGKMKFSSFQRQLNLYGFTRLSHGPDKGGYYHEFFLWGREYLCHRIQRIKLKGNGSRSAFNPDQEPNFYAMKLVGPLPPPHQPPLPPSCPPQGLPPLHPHQPCAVAGMPSHSFVPNRTQQKQRPLLPVALRMSHPRMSPPQQQSLPALPPSSVSSSGIDDAAATEKQPPSFIVPRQPLMRQASLNDQHLEVAVQRNAGNDNVRRRTGLEKVNVAMLLRPLERPILRASSASPPHSRFVSSFSVLVSPMLHKPMVEHESIPKGSSTVIKNNSCSDSKLVTDPSSNANLDDTFWSSMEMLMKNADGSRLASLDAESGAQLEPFPYLCCQTKDQKHPLSPPPKIPPANSPIPGSRVQ